MMNHNFTKTNHSKTLGINNHSIGIAHLTEPIIVAGKYFGIKLLSTYEFMKCMKMETTLAKEIMDQGFDKHTCKKICEYACFVSMCLYDSQNHRVFTSGMDALKNLTPEELSYIYHEYTKLLHKVLKKDNVTRKIVENAKKYYYQKEKIL